MLERDDGERPKKRARSASPIAGVTRNIEQDPDYYFSDGSTIILVQNVLFKVHRTILCKDSSAFETMFKLPLAEGTVAEGGGDDDPIVLHGDTPQQFRSLLWALYALPHEIIKSGSTQGEWEDFDRFCDLAYIVHKYNFKNLETWALSTFLHWLYPSSRPQPPRIHSNTAMSLLYASSEKKLLDRLRRVLDLAVLCDDTTLHNAVVQRLQDELCSSEADLPWFIELSERFAISSLMGAAYYALMIQGRDKWISLARSGQITRMQLAKLHNGYYALVSKWEALRDSPPQIQHCTSGHYCRQRWATNWKEWAKDDEIMAKFPADVIGRLEGMQSRAYTCTGIIDMSRDMHQDCRNRALSAVRALIRETRDDLAIHFVDLL